MNNLTNLIRERGQIKAALTRFSHFFDTSAGVTSVDSLERRFKMNEGLYEKFNDVQSKIELLVADTPDESTHVNIREQFETAYFDLMANVEGFISRSRASVHPPFSSCASPATKETQPTPRLPTIVLPEFDGDYSGWLRFRDTFQSLIHDNESLSDIQRFHYLNSALKGSAARVIRSLGVSEANYKLAWQTLKNRYEDHKSLIFHHGNALLNLQPIHKKHILHCANS